MAFIYRYELRDPYNRISVDFRSNNHDIYIKQAIEKTFGDRLKNDPVFFNNFFEFRLKDTAKDKELRDMGKEIVSLDDYLDSIKKVNYKNKELFQRIKNRFYGFLDLYSDCDNNLILDFNMVDCLDLSFVLNEEGFDSIQANKSEFIKKLDTFNLCLEIDKRDFYSVYRASKHDLNKEYYLVEHDWFLIEGSFTSKDKSNAVVYLDYAAEIIHEGEIEPNIPFRLKSIRTVDEGVKRNLSRYFNFDDLNYKIDPDLKGYSKDEKYHVAVYNVGQGLCTAVCDSQLKPVLYLDFGGGERRDSITYPLGSISLDLSNKPPIVLSHWHRDHWVSIRYFKDAYNCMWIVPRQKLSPEAYKLGVELSDAGNLYVAYSDQNVDPIGTIFVAKGRDTHWHNNGIGLLVQLVKTDEEGNDVVRRYLIPGDNRYEHIETCYFNDLDWLVASHHGGVYFEGHHSCPNNIPRNEKDGRIVYSYGRHIKFSPYYNSHKHPSFVQDYINSGWNEELSTPDGTHILP